MLDDIIKANEGLVYKYLHRYNGLNNPDMISFGFEGLYKAAETYDESKGYAFSTYASTCIFNSIGNYLRSIKNKPVEVSYDDYHIKEVYEEEYEDNSLMIMIVTIAKEFPESEVAIIKAWVNSDFTIKQMELAKTLKCSQAKVSRVLSDFKKKLKERLNERNSRVVT